LFRRKKKAQENPGLNIVIEEGTYLRDSDITLADLMAPAAVIERLGYVDLGGVFGRAFKVVGYPREAGNGWLNRIYLFPHPNYTSQYIYPLPSGAVVSELTEQVANLETGLGLDARRGKIHDVYALQSFRDAESLRQAVANNEVKMYLNYFVIVLLANSLDDLNQWSRELKTDLSAGMVDVRPFYIEQALAIKAALPLGLGVDCKPRNLDSISLASTFPWATAEVFHVTGELWGISLADGSPVVVDCGNFPSAHMIIIAGTGSGKSYQFKNLKTQSLSKGRKVIIIDPSIKTDYQRWTRKLQGAFVVLSAGSDTRINPLEIIAPINYHDLDEDEKRPVSAKAAFLVGWLETLICSQDEFLTAKEKSIILRAIKAMYDKKGIGDNYDLVVNKDMPILEDLYDALKAEAGGEDLAIRLEPFVDGFLDVFNGQTNVDLSKDLIVFNINSIVSSQEVLAPAVYALLCEFIIQRLRRDLSPKDIGIDEAHHMFTRGQTAKFVTRLFREARKSNGRVTLITQTLTDFLGKDSKEDNDSRKAARVCLSQAYVKFLMGQPDPTEVDYIARTFNLSEAEAGVIRGRANGELPKGQGILIAGAQKVPVSVDVSPSLHILITTNPEEVARLEEIERQQEVEAS